MERDIVARLRAVLHEDRSVELMNREAADEIERIRAERDEARREVCELRCNPPERFVGLPHELAEINGWDCYREGRDAPAA